MKMVQSNTVIRLMELREAASLADAASGAATTAHIAFKTLGFGDFESIMDAARKAARVAHDRFRSEYDTVQDTLGDDEDARDKLYDRVFRKDVPSAV